MELKDLSVLLKELFESVVDYWWVFVWWSFVGLLEYYFCQFCQNLSLKLHKSWTFVSNRHETKVGQSEKFGFIGIINVPFCCQADSRESSLELLYIDNDEIRIW